MLDTKQLRQSLAIRQTIDRYAGSRALAPSSASAPPAVRVPLLGPTGYSESWRIKLQAAFGSLSQRWIHMALALAIFSPTRVTSWPVHTGLLPVAHRMVGLYWLCPPAIISTPNNRNSLKAMDSGNRPVLSRKRDDRIMSGVDMDWGMANRLG